MNHTALLSMQYDIWYTDQFPQDLFTVLIDPDGCLYYTVREKILNEYETYIEYELQASG